MAMVCPRCNTTFQDRYHCPGCGIALVPAVYAAEDSGSPGSQAKWQQTALGRGVVGLLLAQGLYYGFWQLCTALVVATGDNGLRWWSTWAGWSLLQVLMVVSLVAGGMLAGAGQRHGPLFGAALGFVNGLLFLVVPKGADFPEGSSETFKDVVWFGQPLIQALIAALGGGIGAVIWRPLLAEAPPPAPPPPTSPLSQRMPLTPVRPNISGFAGPVAWVRVVGGTILALLGSAWANFILSYMIEASDYKLTVGGPQHAHFVTWEISILALLLGSSVAGTNCRNGMKQGLIVGLFTAAGLIAIHLQLRTSGSIPAPALLLAGIRPVDPADWGLGQIVALTVLMMVPLATLGGWFGGQLLPPLVRPPGQKGLFAQV